MRNKKRAFRRILPLFLAMVLCIGPDMTAFAQTADTPAPQAKDADISTGDIISFGSYPQAEVTGKALTEEIINAEYDENGDAVVNGQKYRRYKEAVKVTKDDYKGYVEKYQPDNSFHSSYWEDYTGSNYTVWWEDAYLEECQKIKTEAEGTYRYFKWEPIKWKVLENETEEGTLFVMANTVLDAVNYHAVNYYDTDDGKVLWEESDLCQWMNTDTAGFYQTAFDSSEKECIKVSDENPGEQPVYLLSQEEVKNTEYGFEDTDDYSSSRVMYASAYAQARGAVVVDPLSNLQCDWFLRTLHSSGWYVKTVSRSGGIYDAEYCQEYRWYDDSRIYERKFPGCVPVMHIDASSVVKAPDKAPVVNVDISPGDIISFGSYPQTEVTGKALTNEIINAKYDKNGDAVVDGQKYRRYKEAVKVTKDDYMKKVTEKYSTKFPSTYWDDDETYNYTSYWNSAYLEECEKEKTEKEGTYRYFKWEPIKWKVLENETEEGTLFVMADTVLDAGNYHGEYSEYNTYPATVSWEDSDLCQWMNTDAAGFYQTAFDSSEKESIKVSSKNPGKKPIYLPSDEEVKNTDYGFEDIDGSSNSRVMYASAYATARGAAVYNKISNLKCSWFLRTPGKSYYVKNVNYSGGIYDSVVKYYQAYRWNGFTYERTFNGCVPVMHIDASSVAQDSDETGVKNFDYTFTSLDGTSVSTNSDSGQATVLVFGRTDCVNSRNTIRSIAASQWVQRSDIRVIFAECDFSSSEEVQSFADTYGSDDITFCYDTGTNINNATWAYYYRFYDSNAFIMPLTVVIDGENRIRHCLTGYQTAAAIRSLMDEFVAADPSESDNGKTIKAEFDVTYGQSEARQMLSRINEFRTGDGAWEWNSTDTEKIHHTNLGELTYDYELEKVAMQRAADLVAAYSHPRPDGTDCFTAYPSEFNKMAKGENIAVGQRTEEAVFEDWKEENDPYSGQGHRRNMLSDKFQAVGIAHVVYNGCHYWVQEFSSGVVSAAETPAIDSEKTVNVEISKDLISTQNLKLSEDDIQMKAWTKQELPQVYMAIRTTGTWSSGPSLEFPVTAEWSVSSGEDVVRISEGSLYALKEGDARVTASYNGETTDISVTVAPNPAVEEVQETLEEYESKLADYPETEKEELQALLETIKGDVEAALAEGDLETAEAALAQMEAALEEKAAGKKEEAKQELEELKDSITADEELDDDQRAEIEDVLREAETAIENAKDATAVKEALEDAQQKIDEIKSMSPELRQEKKKAQQQIDAWNKVDFLAKYGEAEQTEIKKIADKLAVDMKGKTKPEEIQKLLSQAKAEVNALKTEEQKELEQEALNTARNNAINNLNVLESKLGDYRAEEQAKIKNAIAQAKTKIDAAENEDAIREALEAAKRVFIEQPTDAELKEQEEADKNDQGGTGIGTGTATLTLSQSTATLYTGKASNTVTIKATVTGGTSKTVIWTTSNPNVATVMNGNITAVNKGTATITATANGISKTVTVTVKNPTLTIKKGSKKFTKKKLTVKKGKKVTLTVAVNPKKSGISITKLKKKLKKIANVTLKGSKITIKGKKKGTVTLKIKSGKATKKIKIIVK